MKTCCRCKIEKQTTEFNKDLSRRDGFRPQCKSCISECSAVYRDANRGKAADYQAEYYAANRDKVSAKQSVYYAENSEKIAAAAPAWQIANPEKRAAHHRNRRALKRNASGIHTADDAIRILDNQGGLCANCHKKLFKSGKQKYHVDHIVPLSRGGSNDKYNLQCLCPSCNLRKRDKDPMDWARQQGRLL